MENKHKCNYEPLFIVAECKCGHKCAVEIEESSKELITLKKTNEEKNTKPLRRNRRKS